MKKARDRDNGLTQAASQDQGDNLNGDTMSPAMRRLILNFVKADSEQTWNPGAYARVRTNRLR